MLYVYIINIFIYSGTRSVLGSVLVRFGYFGYKNIGTVRVFEGISPILVSGISVRFRFGSSVPVILPRPNCMYACSIHSNKHSICLQMVSKENQKWKNNFKEEKIRCRQI